MFEFKRPVSELETGALSKAVLAVKDCRGHFRKLIAVKQPCIIRPAIAWKMVEEKDRIASASGARTAAPASSNVSANHQGSEPRHDASNRHAIGNGGRRDSNGNGGGRGTVREREADAPTALVHARNRANRARFGPRPDAYVQGDLKKRACLRQRTLPTLTSSCQRTARLVLTTFSKKRVRRHAWRAFPFRKKNYCSPN